MSTSDLNILVSWHTFPWYIPPFNLSTNQTTVGPQEPCKNSWSNSSEQFAAPTPSGAYDLPSILRQNDLMKDYDLLVVRSDASMTNLPRNLAAIDCPKLSCPAKICGSVTSCGYLGTWLSRLITSIRDRCKSLPTANIRLILPTPRDADDVIFSSPGNPRSASSCGSIISDSISL